MKPQVFIDNYRKAFGEAPKLPIAFWYSEKPKGELQKINGCFFKGFDRIDEGLTLTLNEDTIGCGGGKFYSGFIDMPERIPNFVSLKERYKQTPEQVLAFIQSLDVQRAKLPYLNFAQLDKLDSFDKVEGLLFFATPDVLSGLTAWTFFDNNEADAVLTSFGSGCSAVVTQAVVENKTQGKRTFLGCFDPSVRPWIDANVLSFVIPMSRFSKMYDTITQCCLFDTHAWSKVRDRINS